MESSKGLIIVVIWSAFVSGRSYQVNYENDNIRGWRAWQPEREQYEKLIGIEKKANVQRHILHPHLVPTEPFHRVADTADLLATEAVG